MHFSALTLPLGLVYTLVITCSILSVVNLTLIQCSARLPNTNGLWFQGVWIGYGTLYSLFHSYPVIAGLTSRGVDIAKSHTLAECKTLRAKKGGSVMLHDRNSVSAYARTLRYARDRTACADDEVSSLAPLAHNNSYVFKAALVTLGPPKAVNV